MPSCPAPNAIYLSPHLDDAVLSCGAGIAARTAEGERVLVVTVCTGEPVRIGPFAERLHAFWGLATQDVIEIRRAEDRAAVARLGAEPLHLGFLDAIYRQPDVYDCDERIYGEIRDDGAFLEEVVATLRELGDRYPSAAWYVPLAIGTHVDHQIAHLAGRELTCRGGPVWFYEDIPYVLAPGALELRTAQFEPDLVHLSQHALDLWLCAMSDYRSQFTDHAALRCSVRDYVRGLGNAQRVWRPRLN